MVALALRHLVICADEVLGPCLLCKTVKERTDQNYTKEGHGHDRAFFLYVYWSGIIAS